MNSLQEFVIPGSRLARQHAAIQTELDRAVAGVIRRAIFTPGPEVEAFEAEFARYIGVKYAVGVSSGSAAVLLALKALGLQPGDEVISTPQVDISASAPVTQAGVRLVGWTSTRAAIILILNSWLLLSRPEHGLWSRPTCTATRLTCCLSWRLPTGMASR
ncbi:MAG: DegT/DnrJ/EryC1/StrS aminotransferase family protein [Anaerolineales bacterium]|nr:DegT/DnrJ/EryC1/StrS aminotransferase family protein [Anaerolineales bacterium]